MSGYRSVVVTGAGAGIGRAIVRRLDADGYRVLGIEQNAASAQTAERELSSSGRIIPGDVTDRLVLQQARALGERGGEFVGWVNNAAVAIGGNLHDSIEKVEFQNKVAVVTGGATGIGRATTLAMLRGGATVVVAGIGVKKLINSWQQP